MNENAVEIASLVGQIVRDTLKASAPGISMVMREAIAVSVATKVRHTLVPTPTVPRPNGGSHE